MKKLIFSLLFLVQLSVMAQHAEYLTTINPTAGTIARIDSLPGIKWIRPRPPLVTIDPINSRYYFVGMTSASVETLYSANLNTGKLLVHGNYSVSSQNYKLDAIGNFEFNQATGYINGLANYWGSGGEAFAYFRLDTSSVQVTTISLIGYSPMTLNLHTSTFDQAGQRYIFMADNYVIALDAITGSTLSSCWLTGGNHGLLRYNNATGKTYIMRMHPKPIKLLEINLLTCQVIDTLASLPNVTPMWSPFGPYESRASIDEQKNIYTYGDYNASNKLYSIDLSTGSLVASPNFTYFNTTSNENVIEMEYNPADGKLYALHWGLPMSTTGVRESDAEVFTKPVIFPNPSGRAFTVSLQDAENCTRILVTDVAGSLTKEIGEGDIQRETKIADLKAGVYNVEVIYKSRTERLRAVVMDND